MLAAVLSLFVLAVAAPIMVRRLGTRASWIMAALPFGLALWFGSQLGAISSTGPITESLSWVPSLGIGLSFHLDGLSLLFAILITGIGALILVYSGAYMRGDPEEGRFLALITAFMAAMLGLVLADDLIVLFVFWELTSITSFLLIGFKHKDAPSRRNALQALLITGTGGLALLGGFILVGIVTGTYSASVITDGNSVLRDSGLYLPIFILFALGAFSKSALVPFHFWLPNAMAAPTPVSAFLHSATMVKAGIYLLARFNPALGGTDLWFWTLCLGGAATMVLGASKAIGQRDVKQILANTTTMALGALVLMLGLASIVGTYAYKAFAVFLVVHAFYKGCLFMVAGGVDHATGTRDVERLGALARQMPLTCGAAVLAALSMVGMPPMFGFIGKEFFYEATLSATVLPALWTGAAVVANALVVVAALLVIWHVFFETPPEPLHAHEGPTGLWLGPLILGALGLAFGLFHERLEPLLTPKVAAIAATDIRVDLYLWAGIKPPLILSVLTLSAGIIAYVFRRRLVALGERIGRAVPTNLDQRWDPALKGLFAQAGAFTSLLQTGRLRDYVFATFLVTAVALLVVPLATGAVDVRLDLSQPRVQDWAVGALVVAGALLAAMTRNRLAAVTAVGVVGYGVGLVFMVFAAPDLAYTQFMVETLAVIILVLVLIRLPRAVVPARDRATRVRDAAVAIACGTGVTVMVWTVTAGPFDPKLTQFFAAESLVSAYGRNIVNVILVDFRALDTFGEIAVVALAAIAALALLRGRAPEPRTAEGATDRGEGDGRDRPTVPPIPAPTHGPATETGTGTETGTETGTRTRTGTDREDRPDLRTVEPVEP